MNPEASRADAFAVLAACYAEPEPGLAGSLDKLCRDIQLPEGVDRYDARELKDRFETCDLHELKLDHARLFVGPFELAAPPFGSVYLEDRRTLMGESTQDAAEIYRQAGLDMAEDFKNPPDHIIAELEFLAYLLSAQLAADEETAQNLEALKQRFLSRHLGAWIEPFAAKVKQGAETGFYSLLGEVTLKMVTAELSREWGTPLTY